MSVINATMFWIDSSTLEIWSHSFQYLLKSKTTKQNDVKYPIVKMEIEKNVN
jgi:hypothetical protein